MKCQLCKEPYDNNNFGVIKLSHKFFNDNMELEYIVCNKCFSEKSRDILTVRKPMSFFDKLKLLFSKENIC
jgi:hypothetical protein